jgi:ankyrin repeat protein
MKLQEVGVTIFKIASSFLILLMAMLCSIGMALSAPGPQPKQSENLGQAPFRTAQLLKEVNEQEYAIAEFINAARIGDAEKVDKFLGGGMDINAKNKSGNTALMEACSFGQIEIIKLLLDRKADPAIKNNIGETATSKAIKGAQYKTINLLVERKALQGDAVVGESILHAEAEFVEGLFQGVADELRQKILTELLHLACLSGKTEVVKLFLDKGADPNQNKGLPLCVCSGGQGAPMEAVKLLLESGADPNLWDKESALAGACDANRPDVVSLLLERGAKVNAQGEKGETALMAAVVGASSKDPIVQILLDKGADVNAKSKLGYTALAKASEEGRVAAALLLIDKGANVNVKAEHGVTPLHLAAYTGSVELVELLLAKGADPNARSDKGATPLVAASRQGHKKVEAVLLRHGAKK